MYVAIAGMVSRGTGDINQEALVSAMVTLFLALVLGFETMRRQVYVVVRSRCR